MFGSASMGKIKPICELNRIKGFPMPSCCIGSLVTPEKSVKGTYFEKLKSKFSVIEKLFSNIEKLTPAT